MTQSASKSMIPDDIKCTTPSSEEIARAQSASNGNRTHSNSTTASFLNNPDHMPPYRSTSLRSGSASSGHSQGHGQGQNHGQVPVPMPMPLQPLQPQPQHGAQQVPLPMAPSPKLVNKQQQEASHSKNPLKKIFGRSKSHHAADQGKNSGSGNGQSPDLKQRVSPKQDGKPSTSVRARGASLLHKDRDVTQHMHLIKSSSAISNLSHNTNPVLTSSNGRIPIESLDIHTRPPTISQLYHSPSSASATPSSTSLGFYQTEGDSKGENILPLPLKNPNDFLPKELQQPSVMLTDNFAFADSGRKNLGEGGSSQVMTVMSIYRKKNVYALKRFKLFKDETPDHFYHRCVSEFLIAKKLSNHVNIVKTYYLMKTPSISNGPKRSWAFLMQRCSQDMFHFTTLTGWASKPLDEKWCCFKQISRGVRYMHSLGIAHRDIKLENVLVTEYGALKLTDFGISAYGIKDPDDPSSERIKIRGYCGSPPHVPPEVMILSEKKRKVIPVPKEKEEYDPFKMDTWALGILMFNLVCSFALFGEAHKDDSKYRNFASFHEQFCKHSPHFKKPGIYRSGPGAEHPDFGKMGSVEASRVCLRLLDPDPNTRYSIEDLFNDPWMEKVETCFDEDDEEPLKEPELRKATTDDDPVPHDIPSTSSSFNEDSTTLTHSSNPFLQSNINNINNAVKSPKIKSKSMLFIAEEEDMRRSATNSSSGSPQVAATNNNAQVAPTSLPTLDEEKTKDVDDDIKGTPETFAKAQQSPQSPVPVNNALTERISSLSLNTANNVNPADHGENSANTLMRNEGEAPSTSNDGPNSLYSNSITQKPSFASDTVSRSSSITSKNNSPMLSNSTTMSSRKRKKNLGHHHSECGGIPIFALK